jgi:energy-coupling factor transporter ATP-binding protein EcfA2/predicted  nucleic acid-binding Zn-ribbon protein
MFERIQLDNWGPFHGQAIPFDAPIVDLCADNGAGKSTILDAIAVAVGCGIFAHDQRDVADYQNVKTKPAYIALTIRNPAKGETRRAFAGYGERLTVLCRVDAGAGRMRSYYLLDGDADLAQAVTLTSRRGTKWLGLTDYNEAWERAGYPQKDRQNRMFSNVRPNEVVKSKPRGLFDLFQSLASNPDDNRKLTEARADMESKDADVKEFERAHVSGKALMQTKEIKVRDEEQLIKADSSLIEERRCLAVAEYEEADSAARKEEQRLGDAATLAPKLRHERTQKLTEQVRSEKAKAAATEQVAAFTRQRDEHQDFVLRMRAESSEAYHKAKVAREERDEYATYATLAETSELSRRRDHVLTTRDDLNRQLGPLDHRLAEIQARITSWTEHGIPLNIQEAVKDLGALNVEPAWKILPKDRDQAYEDALGPLRYGLLVREKDVAAVVSILTPHRYPGPISTLGPAEYTKQAETGWNPQKLGHRTPIGIYVPQDVEPALNDGLKEAGLRRLRGEERDTKAKKSDIENRIKQLRTDLDELTAQLQKAARRDVLRGHKNDWARAIEEAEVLQRTLTKREENLRDADRNLSRAQAEHDAAKKMGDDAIASIAKIDEQLETLKDAGRLTQLQQVAAAKHETCRSFIDDVRTKVTRSDDHRTRIGRLEVQLKGKTVLTAEQFLALSKEVDALRDDQRTDADRLEEKRDNREKSRKNLEDLEADQQRHIRSEFQKAKGRIDALAQGLDFKVKMDLGLDSEQRWVIEYKVKFAHHDAFVPINAGKMSSGQEQMAAFAFCLGLTTEHHTAWYCLDEPSKNFDYRNTEHLFKILRLANAQIVMTSAKDLDYPAGTKVARYYLAPMTPERVAPPVQRIRIDMPVLTA